MTAQLKDPEARLAEAQERQRQLEDAFAGPDRDPTKDEVAAVDHELRAAELAVTGHQRRTETEAADTRAAQMRDLCEKLTTTDLADLDIAALSLYQQAVSALTELGQVVQRRVDLITTTTREIAALHREHPDTPLPERIALRRVAHRSEVLVDGTIIAHAQITPAALITDAAAAAVETLARRAPERSDLRRLAGSHRGGPGAALQRRVESVCTDDDGPKAA